MKYEKCLSCEQLGTTCDGPNLLSMDTVELGQWCNELRKNNPGMTYDRVATDTQLSKSAVRDFLIGSHVDCSMHTARTIAKYITNGKWDDNPCGNVSNNEKAAYEERIKQLETEVDHLDVRLKAVKKTNESLETLVKNNNTRTTQDKEFLRGEIKCKNRSIVVLGVLLGISVMFIMASLIIDSINPNLGFFWNR